MDTFIEETKARHTLYTYRLYKNGELVNVDTFSILDAFGVHPAINIAQWKSYTEAQVLARVSALEAAIGVCTNYERVNDPLTDPKEVYPPNVEPYRLPDLRAQICNSPERIISLGEFLPYTKGMDIQFAKKNVSAPNLIDPKTGTIMVTSKMTGTYTFQVLYKLDNEQRSALCYVTIRSKVVADTVKNITMYSNNKYPYCLSQILGIELNGLWSYNTRLQPWVVQTPGESQEAAIFFDGYRFARENNDPEWSLTNGNKLVSFVYTGNSTCSQASYTLNIEIVNC